LPGPEGDINNYNTLNQYLINIKISIMDLPFLGSKPSNPGTPTSGGGGSTISLPISEASSTSTSVLASASGTPSIVSESLPTVTPNTPVNTVQTLSPAAGDYVNKSVSTIIDGITVSKMVETINIFQNTVDEECSTMLKNHAAKTIIKITD
jgi:hypothetical protein